MQTGGYSISLNCIELHSKYIMATVHTVFIQSSDDVVDIVREEPPAVQDGGEHGGYGPAGHHLIVGVFVHLAETSRVNCKPAD